MAVPPLHAPSPATLLRGSPARRRAVRLACAAAGVGAGVLLADLGEAAVLLPAGALALLLTCLLCLRGGRSRHRGAAEIAALGTAALVVWCVSLLGVQHSVVEAREHWARPRGDAGGLLYVALGDSSAQGVGASRPDLGYVGLLADQLRAETGRPVQVINLSRSGARVGDVVREQLPRLAALQVDVVTVAVGGNDVRGYDARAFTADVGQLTARLPAGAVVADVPYFMHGHWERDADEAARTVRRSAESEGLTVVPLHAALQREGWTAMLTQTAADWFHPDDHGYRVWAAAFWPAVQAAAARVPAR